MNASTGMATQDLLTDRCGGVARLTLNRPEKRNALSRGLLDQFGAALSSIAGDRKARVVVLAANGPVFSAGHDLSEMAGGSEAEYGELFEKCSSVMQQLRRLPQPVIARVHAPAIAAGCQLVASCDLVVAAAEAAFSTPGVKIGLFCATPMVPLVRAIPAKPAMEMLLTGEPISAERAWQLGLVNRVVPRGELDGAVQECVNAILAMSPAVIRMGKRAFYEQLAMDEAAAYSHANQVMIAAATHRDAQQGMSAFLEKRQPAWTED